MRGRRAIAGELGVALAYLALAVLFFWPVIFGGKTLLPLDNLYTFQPFKAFAEEQGVGLPHNTLLGDLVLENYAWKAFILETLGRGQLPLWNPYLFTGVPFLAAGQHSALYPFSIFFYTIPLPSAYGLFTALHFALAGIFTYVYLRVLGAGRGASFISGAAYAYSLFMITSVVFPMIVAAATWLPLILAFAELALRSWETSGHRAALPFLLFGSLAIGLQFLAGHIEISYYIVLVTVFYSLCRLGSSLGDRRPFRSGLLLGLGLASMIALGVGLAAVQLVPLYELARVNFRQASASLSEILGYAYPLRQVATFVIPDFFGNPSQHQYFDLFRREMVPFTQNALGQPIAHPEWGIKNYVESGSYIGILPLLLAAIALLARPSRYVWIFAALAIISLLFVFGTPLYAVLFYFLPGVQQLHTPFRWIFPYTLCMAVLAGLGADAIIRGLTSIPPWRRLAIRAMGAGALLVGLALSLLALSVFVSPSTLRPWAEALLAGSADAQRAFSDGGALLSYQWRNFTLLAVFLSLSGFLLMWATFSSARRLWSVAASATLALDLFVLGYGFNPAVEPRLADFTPPALEFLERDGEPYRITALERSADKTLNPNAAMLFGIQDIRGYDSIIPKPYTEFMGLLEPQGQLLFNRIAPLYDPKTLASSLLDFLNVKYIVSVDEIDQVGYTLVYAGEMRIYRNDDHLPRAFVVPQARVITDPQELLAALRSFDPRREVLIEDEPSGLLAHPGPMASGEGTSASILEYSPNEVVIGVKLSQPGWLVLSDAYFPGWSARVSTNGEAESEARIYKANYNFRAVPLPAGEHLVRFRYSPLSFKLGLYVSFLAAVTVVAGFGYWAWRLLYREEAVRGTVRRVAKNTAVPLLASLLNKGVDLAFALLMLRILGPEGAGKYAFAVVIVGYLEIVSNFGLNTLLTREVAKDPSQGPRYLSNTALLRLILLIALLPFLLTFILVWNRLFNLTSDTILALLLLTLALVPGSLAAALSSLFTAHERMEYPAALTTLSTLLKVSLGLLALLLGYGFMGLAAVAVAVNLITLGLLYRQASRLFFRPRLEFDPTFSRALLGMAYALMINHLLNTLFFKVDVPLLQAFQGDRVVGWYSTAYKVIDGLLIIPPAFTFAVFPIFSRYAQAARETLVRATALSSKALLIVSLPIALLVSAYAEPIILILGGHEFLPHSAIALRLTIWFLPLSFVNGLSQYVLIAIDQQRFITRAFILVVVFNLMANLIFIPRYSYPAAAIITVLSEVVLFLPFVYGLHRHLAPIPWAALAWRPALSAAAMGLILWALADYAFPFTISMALLVYAGALWGLGTFGPEEREALRQLLPARWSPDALKEISPEGR